MGQMHFPGEKLIKSVTGLNKEDEDSDIYDTIIGLAIIFLTIGCIIGCFFSFVNSVKLFVGGFVLFTIILQIKDWLKGEENLSDVLYAIAGLGYFYYLITCFIGLFSNFWVNLKAAGVGTLVFIGVCFFIGLFDNSKD